MRPKKLIHSKTFWTGMATVCTSIGLMVAGEATPQEFTLGIVGFIFIMLRIVTEKPIE